MAYYITTALGREVPTEDRTAVLGDTILKVLYDFRTSPFLPRDHEGSRDVEALARVTGLSDEGVRRVCQQLENRGFLEVPGEARWRISDAGIEYVRDALRRPASGSLG